MGEQIEHGWATLFWKSEIGELKPLEISDVKFNIEPQSNWVQENKSGFNCHLDFQVPKESIKPIYKLFKRRLPRKFKKQYKLRMAKRIGIPANKLKFYGIRDNAYGKNEKKWHGEINGIL